MLDDGTAAPRRCRRKIDAITTRPRNERAYIRLRWQLQCPPSPSGKKTFITNSWEYKEADFYLWDFKTKRI